MKNIALFAACCLFVSTLQASDLDKEQRWRDQVADSIMDGDKEIAGANHFFDGIDDELIDAIHGWLG